MEHELNQESNTEIQLDDYSIKLDRDLRNPGGERLLLVYDQIADESDLGTALAILLTGVHHFGYGLTESNIVNGRQGKTRITFSSEYKALMERSEEGNYDVFEDKELNKLFIFILTQYLKDKMILPDKPKLAKKIEGTVKTLFIMLIATGQYGIISKLEIPQFIKPILNNVFDYLEDQQSEILNSWIQYLEDHESDTIAKIVQDNGLEFWGSEFMNPKSIFDTKFHYVIQDFKDYDETYSVYLKFRDQQLKLTRNIARDGLIEFFNNNPENEYNKNKYDWFRKVIIDEFYQLFTENENALAIQKLIYG